MIHSWSFLVTFTGQTANERDSICAMKNEFFGFWMMMMTTTNRF